MKPTILIAVSFALAPMVTNAQFVLEHLTEGATKAVQAVGETTRGAVNAAGAVADKVTGPVVDIVDSTRQSLGDDATPAQTREKLDAMAEATLKRLFAEQPGSHDLFERSAGYAVFDKREASFYVVAGYGRGVAVDKTTGARTYMKMATTGAGMGLGLGGFASQLVILFENKAAFETFITEGMDATAGIETMTGNEHERLGVRFDNGKAVFVLTGKGWKISAKLTGSRYWPDEELNQE